MAQQFNLLQPNNSEEKGPSKKDLPEMEILKPNHIGLKEDMSWKVDVKSLFKDNIFISIDEFNDNAVPR